MPSTAITVSLKLEEVGRLKTLSLEPGDVLVVESNYVLPDHTIARIAQHLESVFVGHRCVVLSEGLKLKVARSAETPHRADTLDPDGYGHAV